MSYADVLDREHEWYQLDLTAQGVPSLTHGTPTGILNIGHGVGFRRSA